MVLSTKLALNTCTDIAMSLDINTILVKQPTQNAF